MKERSFFLILFLIFLFQIKICGQVVNIEDKRVSDTVKKLQGTVDLSFNFTQNTKKVIQGASSVKLQYYKEKSLFLFFSDIGLGQVDGDRFLDKGFLHLRHNYRFGKGIVTSEVFTQYQYNSLQALKSRYLVGFGPRIRLLNEKNINFYIGPLVMYEHELVDDIAETINKDFRLSSYISLNAFLKEKIKFHHISYFQPRLDLFRDYRISSVSEFELLISKHLSYKVGFSLTYDKKPPVDINSLFYSFTNKLSFKF